MGAAHTMARYETAFHAPILANRDNHPTWLDPATDAALAACVTRRKAEGGAPMN